MWIYNSANGVLCHDGKLAGYGYSGFAAGRNNPAREAVPHIGPLPRGRYEIGPVFDSETHGPVCMRLTPAPDTDTHGRGGFLIHADSIAEPGKASHGCIVLSRPVRMLIAASHDRELEVV